MASISQKSTCKLFVDPPSFPPSIGTTAQDNITARNDRVLDPHSQGKSRAAPETPEVKDRRLMFSYFKSLKKKEHQKMARHWNRKAYGKLNEIMLRNYRYVVFLHIEGTPFRETISSNPFCPSFDEFMIKIDNPVLSKRARVYPAPSDAEVDTVLDAAGDLREGDTAELGTSPAGSEPAFTLNEFSRLIIMLRHNEHCRQSINLLQQELTRAQLDAGRSRDSFWARIADRFNDPSEHIAYSFDGWVEDAEPSLPPLCVRAASVLKDQYARTRTGFTVYKDRWERSGQNDPENFRSFLPTLDNGRHSLTALGKRMLVFFKVSGLGTPNCDDEFVRNSSRVMMDGGFDEGVPSLHMRVVNDGVRPAESESTTGRRRRSLSGNTDKAAGNLITEVTSAIRESVSREEEISRHWNSSEQKSVVSREVQWSKDKQDLVNVLESSVLKLEAAKSRHAPTEYIELLQRHYSDSLKAFARVNDRYEKWVQREVNDDQDEG